MATLLFQARFSPCPPVVDSYVQKKIMVAQEASNLDVAVTVWTSYPASRYCGKAAINFIGLCGNSEVTRKIRLCSGGLPRP